MLQLTNPELQINEAVASSEAVITVNTRNAPHFPQDKYSFSTSYWRGFELREVPDEGDERLGIRMYVIVAKEIPAPEICKSYNDSFCLAKFMLGDNGQIYPLDGFNGEEVWLKIIDTNEKIPIGFE